MINQECKCSIKIEDLSVRKNDKFILNSISLVANHGEIFAIIGTNGSGKTTILKCILNRISYKGKITFLNAKGSRIFRPKIGYVPQKLFFDKNIPMTVTDLFCLSSTNFPTWLGCTKKLKSKICETLNQINAAFLVNKTIGSLSGGELQRVMLAFALEPKPDILLLDEPSSALDNKGIDCFYSLITSLKSKFHMPIILVSHDISKVKKYANKYAMIDNGKVFESGDISKLITY